MSEGFDTLVVEAVLTQQHEATQRGALSMWTIYERPSDWPDGYVARRFESGKDGAVATNHVIRGGEALDHLRTIFERAGLVCLTRSPEDDAKIVETWL